jgi:anti-sigma factor RsiW
LSAYLDGDLEPEESGRVAEHMAECPVCRRALAQVRVIRDGAGAMEQMAPPDRVWQTIRERTAARPERGVKPAWLWVGIPALAAVLLLVVFVTKASFHPGAGSTVATSQPELSKDKLAADAAQGYVEYVEGIDRALDECRQAMLENPGNLRVRTTFAGMQGFRQDAMDRVVSGGD